ncbi:hypothetical protein [Maribacter sp. Asnod2-G09]|uniref:hypothetical protein n=1 Tax=Maribacter sp. Asnod2-G09 TaxID=3160577 RepID=UPI00386BF79F
MTRKIISIIIIFISLSSFGQKIKLNKLDGFKSIKIGTKMKKFSNLKQVNLAPEGYLSFEYFPSDIDLYNVFDSKFDNILLYFDDTTERLKTIVISKTFIGDNLYQKAIKQSSKTIGEFEKTIGTPYEMIEVKDGSGKSGFSWYGNKMYIDVFALSPGKKSKQAKAVVEIGKDVELKY